MWRWLIAIILICGGVIAYEFATYWAVALCIGGILIIGALVTPSKHRDSISKGTGNMNISEMLGDVSLPTVWDENRISLNIRDLLKQSGRAVITRYVEGFTERFIIGQDRITAARRIEFIQQQSELITALVENYKLRREAGRTVRKEDLNDHRLDIEEKQLGYDLENVDLQQEVKREELRTQAALKRYERENIGKEPPPPTPQPTPTHRPPSAEEKRERQRRPLKMRMNEIREEIRITEANPNLSEEEKYSFVNLLKDRLAEIQEDYVKLR